MAAAPAKSGIVVPQTLPWKRRAMASFIALFLRVSMKTWRHDWKTTTEYPESKGNVIFCIWHNRFAMALFSYDEFAQRLWPAQGIAAMMSASRDGAMLAEVYRRFGIEAVRGSTSRRSSQASLEATTWIERGYTFAITPDGPRGPAYGVHTEGIIRIAQLTGRPIIPTGNHARWKICLPTWDRFQIPLPFARVEIFYGEPIWVPRDADDAQREELRRRLERAMRALTRDYAPPVRNS